MKITLKQMTVFDAVARLGSVSEAARQIGLTQSAASMALRELERNLGHALFHRHSHKFALNEHGRRLQPKVRTVLLGAQDVEAPMDPGVFQGPLHIGASTSIGGYLLPELCASFMRDHPAVRIHLTVLPALEINRLIDTMVLDVGFVETGSLRPALRTERWMDDELVVFCGASHPLAQKKKVKPEDLADEVWCIQPLPSVTRRRVTQMMLSFVEFLRIGMECGSVETIKRVVETGVGIGCQSRVCIQRELDAGTLCEVHVSGLDLRRPLNIITRSDVERGSMYDAFVSHAIRGATPSQSPRKSPNRQRARRPAWHRQPLASNSR